MGRRSVLGALEQGEGRDEDLDLLAEQCRLLGPGHTFCALAPGAVEPLQSALKYFRDDFDRHMREQALPLEVARHERRSGSTATTYERGRRQEPAAGLPRAGARPALLLLASGPGFGRAPAASARSKQFKDEDDDQGKIVMACMTPAQDGTRISIDDPEARGVPQAVSSSG